MTDWGSYVGLPQLDGGRTRAGLDCYGLFALFYGEQLGIQLPSYSGDYASIEERAEISGLINGGIERGPWRRVETIRPFDGLLFRVRGHATHVAIAKTERQMLHMHVGRSSLIDWTKTGWRNRFIGAFRHEVLT